MNGNMMKLRGMVNDLLAIRVNFISFIIFYLGDVLILLLSLISVHLQAAAPIN